MDNNIQPDWFKAKLIADSLHPDTKKCGEKFRFFNLRTLLNIQGVQLILWSLITPGFSSNEKSLIEKL